MVEFFVGLGVFIGLLISAGTIFYILGKLILPRFDMKDEKNLWIIMFGGVLGLTFISVILILCYVFYLVGDKILNK